MAMEYSKLWYLTKIGFLDSIPKPAALDFLTHIQHFFFEKNELVQAPDVYKEGIYFVKAGCVRVYTFDEDGQTYTYSILGPGSTYGNLRSFSMHTDDLYIEAIEATQLCMISERSFMQLAEKYPVLLQKAIKILGERLQERERMLKHLALGSVRERIIHLLQTLFNRYGEISYNSEFIPIELPLSQKELANMIGATREATSHALNGLAKEGAVRIPKRRRIELHKTLAMENPLPRYIQQLYDESEDTVH